LAQFLNTKISQGSVATRLRCDGIFNNQFVTQSLLSLLVKEFWKLVNIWWSYGRVILVILTHRVVVAVVVAYWFMASAIVRGRGWQTDSDTHTHTHTHTPNLSSWSRPFL